MRLATICAFAALCIGTLTANAQDGEYLFNVPVSEDLKEPYAIGIQSGARDVYGPVDLDNDGQDEVIVSDYTGGGRAHVIENIGVDTWEWVYSTPWMDSTATTDQARTVAGGDLDGDGMGEILILSGRFEENPVLGLYVYEFNGTDFGDEPAAVYEFGGEAPTRWRSEDLKVMDVDDDGQQEVLFSNNDSPDATDNWYVLSVEGDIGTGFEVWTDEVRISPRDSETFDPVSRGGGSPQWIDAGDLNGDGTTDLILHSWNAFNLTVGQVSGPDDYTFPEDESGWIRASTTGDDVSLFGGVVVDIDQDGNDEAFLPVLCWGGGSDSPTCGSVTVVDYDEGESTLQITGDNVAFAALDSLSQLGLTAGDLDGDGKMELIGSGPAFSGEARSNGREPTFIRIAEYNGTGPITDSDSYSYLDLDYSEPFDFDEAFNEIQRDSAGVDSTYYEVGGQGPEFVSKLAYLGDVDGDGFDELAVAFQGIDDSTFVIEETFNPSTNLYDRQQVDAQPRENRVFMRIIEGSGLSVAVEDQKIIMPQDYRLSDNYPNPFNPSTSFSFTLPVDKAVTVRVYDITGREVKTLLADEFRTAGTYEVTWDGTNNAGHSVASGTYVYSLEWGQFRKSKKMVLVK